MSLDGDLLIQKFPFVLQESYSSIYSSLAALTALSFDILISFGLEVDVIWKEKWNLPKCFYLLGRYLGLVGMILTVIEVAGAPTSPDYCHIVISARYAVLVGSALAVELILLVRVYALYSKNKPVLLLTVIITVGLGGISFVLLIIFLKTRHSKVLPAGLSTTAFDTHSLDVYFPGCYTFNDANDPDPGNTSRLFWIPLLIFESYLFVLTLIKFFQNIQGHRSGGISLIKDRASIFLVFFRDGTIYFAVIFISLFFKVVIANFSTAPVGLAVSGWTPVIFSIAGPRLVLNLRSANKTNEFLQGGGNGPRDIESNFDNFVAGPNPMLSRISDA